MPVLATASAGQTSGLTALGKQSLIYVLWILTVFWKSEGLYWGQGVFALKPC